MNEYDENNQIKEETITMQDLPEQKNLEPNNMETEDNKEEEQKKKKKSTIVKILILIIILLLLLNACSVYHFKKEMDNIRKDCEAKCNSQCKTPEETDKDIQDPGENQNPDDNKDNEEKPNDDNPNVDNPSVDKPQEEKPNNVPDDGSDKRVWKIKFTDPSIMEGSVENGKIAIDGNSAELTFSSNLSIPGDYFIFSVDVYNYGEINARLSGNPIKSSLTDSQERYLLYDVRYADGTEIKANDTLKAGERKTLVFKIEFMREITVADLPQQEETINFAYELNYVE